MKIPFLRPKPPPLSRARGKLQEIEDSGIYSNFGPKNTLFEGRLIEEIFGGLGHCTTVCNATIGLMLAIKAVDTGRQSTGRRLALMPSFTFAATAHAALWAGMTPIFCDIDADTWLPCARSEEEILERFHGEVAVIVPYATFGAALDLERYLELSKRFGVPIVVDAAASLGTLDETGRGFGTGFPFPVVFSMHVTKSFSTTEGGVIYASDPELIWRLRTMSNFGFGEPRRATMPGLNGKLSEVAALSALLRLDDFQNSIARRVALYEHYQNQLGGFVFQAQTAKRQAHQFAPVLTPGNVDPAAMSEALTVAGIGHASYFRPHLSGQSYFCENSVLLPTPITDKTSGRCLSLPMYEDMMIEEVEFVCGVLNAAI